MVTILILFIKSKYKANISFFKKLLLQSLLMHQSIAQNGTMPYIKVFVNFYKAILQECLDKLLVLYSSGLCMQGKVQYGI